MHNIGIPPKKRNLERGKKKKKKKKYSYFDNSRKSDG